MGLFENTVCAIFDGTQVFVPRLFFRKELAKPRSEESDVQDTTKSRPTSVSTFF